MDKLTNEVKKANINLHREEAKIYNTIHKEIFNPIEQQMIMSRLVIASKIANNRLCLDLGCGTGNLTIKESSIFQKVIGVDISREMIELLKYKITNNDKIELIMADCENLPFNNKCFNFISMFSVLHHIPNFEMGLKEAYRVLKNDGVLFIDHEPNDIKVIRFLKKIINKKKGRIRHQDFLNNLDYSLADIHVKQGFNHKIINKILINIGFIKVKIQYHYILPYIPLTFIRPFYIKFWEFLDNFLLTKKYADCLTIIARKNKIYN